MLKRVLSAWILISTAVVLSVPAMETDQYNLPPVPLADIAPEVESYVIDNVQAAIDKLNAEIDRHEACLGADRAGNVLGCSKPADERSGLAYLRSPGAVARAVYDQLGDGTVFTSKIGDWLNSHKFSQAPFRYKAGYDESIYFTAPVDYATLSPTVRMYGVELGTDKIDHIFQQGHTYYRKYDSARREGKSEVKALKAAVSWGQLTENTFYGYTVSGVYSNADLAANLAGMRFYGGLTGDIRLADVTRPATLKLVDGRWAWNEKSGLLRPFVTDHLNEALNPSNYLFFLYPVVKNIVRKRACPEWHNAFPTATADTFRARAAELETWNGQDYGYKRTSRQVRLADVCFAPQATRSQ